MPTKPWCPVCGGRESLGPPAEGNCAVCFNHMLAYSPDEAGFDRETHEDIMDSGEHAMKALNTQINGSE